MQTETVTANDYEAENIDLQNEEIEEVFKECGQDCLDNSLLLYFKEIAQFPVLSKEEESELFYQYRDTQDKKIKEKLVMHNTRLVVSIAKKYKDYNFSFLDAIQDGNLGLIKAIDKFDVTKGIRFSTYATYWIKEAILDANNASRMIKVPDKMISDYGIINRIKTEYEQMNDKEISIEELAEATKIPIEKIKEAVYYMQDTVSLNTLINNETQTAILDSCQQTRQEYNPEAIMLEESKKELVLQALQELSERDRNIIIERYGLNGKEGKSRAELAKEYKLSEARIGQLENKALRKLKSPKIKSMLKNIV